MRGRGGNEREMCVPRAEGEAMGAPREESDLPREEMEQGGISRGAASEACSLMISLRVPSTVAADAAAEMGLTGAFEGFNLTVPGTSRVMLVLRDGE